MVNILKANIQFPGTNIDHVFFALSHPIRRKIVEILTFNDLEVRELSSEFDISKPALIKHLDILEQATIIKRHKEKRTSLCRLNSTALLALKEYIEFYEPFWVKL